MNIQIILLGELSAYELIAGLYAQNSAPKNKYSSHCIELKLKITAMRAYLTYITGFNIKSAQKPTLRPKEVQLNSIVQMILVIQLYNEFIFS